jgi:Reverse transcriptase (RNA-dependent DNA polymerase).
LRAFLIDWYKTFDRINWTKLMQILKITGMGWREGRLLANFTWIRVIKYDWTKEIKNVNIGRGVRQGFCLSPVLFKLYSEYLTKYAVKRTGDFKMREV